LQFPCFSIKRLKSKVESKNKGRVLQFDDIEFSHLFNENNFINTDMLEKIIDYVVGIHPFLIIVDSKKKNLFSENELLDHNFLRERRFKYKINDITLILERYLELINLALAQHTLQTGDILLPKMADDWMRRKHPDLIKKILLNNQVIARNLAAYLVKNNMQDNGIKNINMVYAFANNSNDSTYLKSITKFQCGEDTPCQYLKFIQVPGSSKQKSLRMIPIYVLGFVAPIQSVWAIEFFPGINAPLPTEEEFLYDELVLSQEITKLLRLRNKIIQELSLYTTRLDENSLLKLTAVL